MATVATGLHHHGDHHAHAECPICHLAAWLSVMVTPVIPQLILIHATVPFAPSPSAQAEPIPVIARPRPRSPPVLLPA